MPKGYNWPVYSSNSKKVHGGKRTVSKGRKSKGSDQRGNAERIMSHLGPTVMTLAFTLSKLESQGGFWSKKGHDLTYILFFFF